MAALPGVTVPARAGTTAARCARAPGGRGGDGGCAETVAALRELPGLAGVHVMAVAYERGVPEILTAAGLGRAA